MSGGGRENWIARSTTTTVSAVAECGVFHASVKTWTGVKDEHGTVEWSAQ